MKRLFSDIADACHARSVAAGWWTPDDIINPLIHAVKIALIHSELSEALEGIRKDSTDEHLAHRKSAEVELADAIIRIFDLAGALNYDLETTIVEKLEYNSRRADHKPEARASANGKRF